MSWIQLLFDTGANDAPRLADALEALGAEAVSFFDAEDQPLYEPPLGTTPLWNRTRVSGLFQAGVDMDTVLAELARRIAPQPLPVYRLEPLADRDWIRAWMDSFKPMRFGERLWIVPSWYEPPDAAGVNILLDPGLAFGTGTHPTTRLCLEWLDAHAPAGQQVIDYGCGSGILAIAAALLGARSVWATDNDPQALIATDDNAQRNQVSARIRATLPGDAPAAPADLLLANILAGPLISLAPRFATLLRSGGSLVLSGILAEQAEEVRAAYLEQFVMDAPQVLDGWVRLTGARR
jgi:ribosomal protein L11 methyltransferase